MWPQIIFGLCLFLTKTPPHSLFELFVVYKSESSVMEDGKGATSFSPGLNGLPLDECPEGWAIVEIHGPKIALRVDDASDGGDFTFEVMGSFLFWAREDDFHFWENERLLLVWRRITELRVALPRHGCFPHFGLLPFSLGVRFVFLV